MAFNCPQTKRHGFINKKFVQYGIRQSVPYEPKLKYFYKKLSVLAYEYIKPFLWAFTTDCKRWLFSKLQVSRGKKIIWKGGNGRCIVNIHSPKQLNKTAADASVACPHSGTSHVGVNQRRPKQVPIKIMYHIQHSETSALQSNYNQKHLLWSKIAQAPWSLNPKGFFLKAQLCTAITLWFDYPEQQDHCRIFWIWFHV